MSATFVLLNAVTASTTGAAATLPVVGRDVRWVAHLGGAGGFGSVVLEGSFDGTIWFPMGSLADPGHAVLTGPVRLVRAVYSDDGMTGPVTVQAVQSDV